jgi:mono/diheme cytochrome c family protein
VLIHSLVGCAFYGAFASKIIAVRDRLHAAGRRLVDQFVLVLHQHRVPGVLMAKQQSLHTVISTVLIVSTVLFVAMLAGFGSGFLTDDPPAVSPYASSDTSPPTPPPEEASSIGQELFSARCKSCHGANLAGGVGPALGAGSRIIGLSDDDICAIITDGRSGMPAFGSRLEPGEIDAILEYLRNAQSG